MAVETLVLLVSRTSDAHLPDAVHVPAIETSASAPFVASHRTGSTAVESTPALGLNSALGSNDRRGLKEELGRRVGATGETQICQTFAKKNGKSTLEPTPIDSDGRS
jgi:hypothetical protein